jgi:hypothetical protein
MTKNKIFGDVERLAGELPRDIQPVIDFWPEIEAGIDTPPQEQAISPVRNWWVAAAAILIITSSSLTTFVLVDGTDRVVVPTSESRNQPVITGAGLRTPELLAFSALSDEVRDVVITNLDIVRSARADIEHALQKDPHNAGLNSSWLRVYEQELDLLNEATWTNNDLAERVKI